MSSWDSEINWKLHAMNINDTNTWNAPWKGIRSFRTIIKKRMTNRIAKDVLKKKIFEMSKISALEYLS